MLPIAKQAVIDIYNKQLNNFMTKFIHLTNEEKLLMFLSLVSEFKGHFYDKGKNWHSSISKRFSIDITTLRLDSSLNPDLFRIIVDDDNYIKLIDKTFGKLIENLTKLLNYIFWREDYMKLMDDLITKMEAK